MRDKVLLDNFTKLIDSRKTEIMELQSMYLLKKAQNETVREMFNAIYDEVLQNGKYYAESSYAGGRENINIAAGDRITSHLYEWLMSEKDFDEYLEVCKQKLFEAGLTDEKGFYTDETNTENQLTEIEDKLISLSVEILPDDFPNKYLLEKAVDCKGYNWFKTREKLLELVMKLR